MYLLLRGATFVDLFETKEEALFWYIICKLNGIEVHIETAPWTTVG